MLTGYGDRAIKFDNAIKFLDEDNLLPKNFIVSYNLSASSIAIYDAKTSELKANLSFPYFAINNIAWNSDQSAFVVGNSEDSQYYIIKQV